MSNHVVRFAFLALLLGSHNLYADLSGPSCEIQHPKVFGEMFFYKDGPSTNVSIYNDWGSNWSNVTGFGGSSDKELEMQFLKPWGSVRLQGKAGLYPLDYGSVTFTVRSWGENHNLYPYFVDQSGSEILPAVSTSRYLVEGSLSAAERTVNIPISDLIGDSNQKIAGFSIQSDLAGTTFIDNIKLEPKTPGLVTLYSDYLGAALNHWDVNLSTESTAPFAGKNALKASFTANWGGIELAGRQIYSNEEFGAITLAVKGTTSGQDIYVYLVNERGEKVGQSLLVSDFVYGGNISPNWQVAWIPLRDLVGPQTVAFNGVGILSNVPGVVWLDEVKVVEKLVWPLPGITRFITHPFGVDWVANLTKKHTGADYRSGNNGYGEAGISVAAAHDGKIVSTHINSGNWGCTVVIQSVGNTFTTTYIHLKNDLTVGMCGDSDSLVNVKAGKPVGETVWLSTGPHLHLGLRVKPYMPTEKYDTWKGALLPNQMPEAFVDPELIEWR